MSQPDSPNGDDRGARTEGTASATPARRRWALVVAGGLAAAAGAGWNWWRTSLRDVPRTVAAETLWSLRFDRPEGGELVLAELRGRPLLINFWATWCPPCIKEMPVLDRFHATHGQRVQVIGLAIDRLDAVQAFLARQPVRFAVGLASVAGSELSRTLGNEMGALPFTVLLDAQGYVAQRKLGESRYDELVGWSDRL
jgi:thiol-disulfide isomerase/thioredoxin